MKRILLWTLLGSVLLVAGCAERGIPAATPRPTSTLVPTITPTSPPPVALVDAELLGASGVNAACDHPPEAQLTCSDETTHPRMAVDVGASTYARWSLQWEDRVSTPLTGNETLALDVQQTGDLRPNLYLVERDGVRFPVKLRRFGLREGTQTVHIPLHEIKDEEGNMPDFANLGEVQIVFEWADMAGELVVESLRFESVWEDPVAVSDAARDMAAGLQVPDGFVVEAVADNLQGMTQIQYTPDGDMLVSLQNGQIWWYSDTNDDGVYDTRHLYITGFTEVVGLLYDPLEGDIWIGGRGQLYRTLDSDGNGVADLRELRIDGMSWGRHQNNGLDWNPDPDPFTGEPARSWIYFGLGATGDLEIGGDLNATVLRFPRDGQGQEDVEVVSRGNRNAYGVLWVDVPVDLAEPDGERNWQLFASENGPDFENDPDEVNHIRWGYHYGFPDQFGWVGPDEVDGEPFAGPVYPVLPHTSANALAYIHNPDWPAEYRTLYVSLFGEVFSPIPVGHKVERISLTEEVSPQGDITYRGQPSDFVTAMDRPLPMITGPDGNLVVGDYATGVIYRVAYRGE